MDGMNLIKINTVRIMVYNEITYVETISEPHVKLPRGHCQTYGDYVCKSVDDQSSVAREKIKL